jgi:hypothetical protein
LGYGIRPATFPSIAGAYFPKLHPSASPVLIGAGAAHVDAAELAGHDEGEHEVGESEENEVDWG